MFLPFTKNAKTSLKSKHEFFVFVGSKNVLKSDRRAAGIEIEL